MKTTKSRPFLLYGLSCWKVASIFFFYSKRFIRNARCISEKSEQRI